VTRKITVGIAKIVQDLIPYIELGNIDAKRDWGYAPDYVNAMWLMLQHDKPDDYVVATGETHSVREFCEVAFRIVGFEIEWSGKGVNEVGIDRKSGRQLIRINPKFYRPTEVDLLLGDPGKAQRILGWKPKVTFEELAEIMVESDLKRDWSTGR